MNNVRGYTGKVIEPFLEERGNGSFPRSVGFAPSLSMLAGALVAQITSAAANAKWTITQTNAITGSSTLTITTVFGTVVINATGTTFPAAAIQTALDNLPGVGQGNLKVTGTGLNGNASTVVIEAQNLLAGMPIDAPTVATTDATATFAIAVTTTGVAGKKFVAYDGTKIANPSQTAATATFTTTAAADGGFAAGPYDLQITWGNAQGETLPGFITSVLLADADYFRVAAINAANTPDDATVMNVYANGARIASIAVTTPGTAGNIVALDIKSPGVAVAAAGGASVVADAKAGQPLPQANTAFKYGDGRQIAKGVLAMDTKTDIYGRVTHSSTTTVGSTGAPSLQTEALIWQKGIFRNGDIATMTADALADLNGRILSGTGLSDAEALIAI